MMKYFLIILSFLFVSNTVLFAQQSQFQFSNDSWKSVRKQAKKNKKLIFVQAMSSNCGACKELESRVFDDKELADLYNKSFILFRIDSSSTDVKKLVKKLSIKAYPTSYIIDRKGNVIHKIVGLVTKADLVDMANRVIENKGTLAHYQKTYAKGKFTKSELFDYARVLLKASENYKSIADEYFSRLPEESLSEPQNVDAIVLFTDDVNSREFAFLARGAGELHGLVSSVGDVQMKVEDVISYAVMGFMQQTRDEQKMNDTLRRIFNVIEVHNQDFVRERVMLDYYDIVAKDYPHYFHLLMGYVETHLSILSTPQLASYCRRVSEDCKDREVVAMSLMWISMVLEKEQHNKDYYEISIDLLLKAGHFEEARETGLHMVEMCKDVISNPEQIIEMLEKRINNVEATTLH